MNRAVLYYSFLLILGLFAPNILQAQIDPTPTPQYVDATDLRKVIRGKKYSEGEEAGTPKKGKLMKFIVPIFGANPTLGAFYGIGGTGAIFLGDPETTSISSMNASLQITTKNQFVAGIKGTIMTPDNGWEMLVDLRYSFFSENTYGLGSDNSQLIKESWNWGGVTTNGLGGAQPLSFNQVKVYYTALKEVTDNFYMGIGYHLDYHYKIEDLSLDLEEPDTVITSHYAYNTINDISTTGYTTSGVSFNLVYDSRDHTVNPYKGAFIQLMNRNNPEKLGSSKNSNQMYFEGRYYLPLSTKTPRHLIGFWGIAHVLTAGKLPYLHLPANAYDMRNRIGRGYVAGRFRGPGWVTLETEYRFPISRNGLLGGVLFASATTTSREAITIGEEVFPELKLFEATKPAAGLGARIMLNRTGRLNLAMDMAFGQNGAKGFYFAVGETF